MAYTARTNAEEREYFDDEETLKKKVAQLAEFVRNSKHFIAFTGAGVSTAAGYVIYFLPQFWIPDFRSGKFNFFLKKKDLPKKLLQTKKLGVNTTLETGAGKWARDAAKQKGIEVTKPAKTTQVLKALPTFTVLKNHRNTKREKKQKKPFFILYCIAYVVGKVSE
ncbi:transcriptional regulator, Sir2 family protein [Reticulomyxa filosa]|uniref:Transcriptional regulator, Sir2 family protein n=1 Tax=Reticulomyxa filosa TaxID=46433 RepID=X6NIE7_RETFI|nr:transcriptional regulator, Sir2 family protein [Reticulomyxa filosa]|eukprot:ETO25484.1 transcriptional regulator, Sir2 family protein [Reticulomyxa filosa]